MVRRVAVLACIALGAGVACGGGKDKGEKDAASKACPAAPAELAKAPKLPTGFPLPAEVTFTGTHRVGPSTIVTGYWAGEIDEAFDGYEKAFKNASGYEITKDEHEEVDAEVNFSGGSSTGQVKLLQTCKDRTSVTITIRPA